MRVLAVVLGLTTSIMAQQEAVRIPVGVTRLGDIGRYRVAYQSYGKEVVDMPDSWSGHFEAKTGVSYWSGTPIMGRESLLIHSPWRVEAGKVWVDYRLVLPDTEPIKLAFGIAMKPGVVAPGKSDGVTFSCFLDAGKGFGELMRYHQTKAEWRDYEFDLTPQAGRTVTLRLQVEPGPENDFNWDYSYFGDARIEVRSTTENLREAVARLVARPAYKAVAEKGLAPLANDPERGVVPASLIAGTNEVQHIDGAWMFSYQGEDCRIEYRYVPKTGTLDDLTVCVDGGEPFRPAAGSTVAFDTEVALQQKSVARDGDAVVATFTGADCDVAWRFGIRDKALLISVTCEKPNVAGVTLGNTADVEMRRQITVPYFDGTLDYLPATGLYVSRLWDWTRSNASVCRQGSAVYHKKTDGTRNAVSETGCIVVSPSVHEALPNLPNPRSPYMKLLGDRIMLDVWKHHRNNSYAGDAEILRELKDNGIDHLAIIQHSWQRYGYDVKLPDHFPANPKHGGDEGMVEYGRAANECGYIWSLHENYIDFYRDAPSFDPSAQVLKADGSPSKAYYNEATGDQSYGLKCNRALEFAKQNAAKIHGRYKTTAAYLDVHTALGPWHQLDHEAGQPFAAMARGKVKYNSELFQYMRDTHEGPMFGEGWGTLMYWAGRCDGVEAQVDGGEDHPPFLDFDLLRLHPLVVNHGMGYYERWYRQKRGHVPGVSSCAPFQIDKYRAQELAYGHAGFIGSLATDNIPWIAKEHHLMHPVQRLYGTAKATHIEYEVAGQFVTASVVLGLDAPRERQRITYDSGLRLWVNWGEEPWTVEGRTLPQWGFLALGPDTEVWTAETRQGMADYASCPEFVFADARTHFQMPYVRPEVDVEPRICSFKWLGKRRAEITYEWRVGEDVDEDYRRYVHFLNEGVRKRDMIAGQSNPSLKRPTTTWRKDDMVVDGPHIVRFPDTLNDFEIVVCLSGSKGRIPMKGTNREGLRYLIGVLRIADDGQGRLGDIVAARAEREQKVGRADFTRNMNKAGTWVDFGEIATDGSVKVNRGDDQLTVFPYPRGRPFTVELDPGALGLAGVPVKVQALKAGSDEILAEISFESRGKRIRFAVGREGAGRYRVLP